ncbi:coagulation factor X-like isoform X2 [Contarinia nasturtii]|uniref:coagulation factor X-like isoform X2 n=1 Tax=Contarinia nasturtii TaxID=265458 RepID=UPI0012D47891|nr:coagulation factor X-like isoform X2 [Contarinia nasturtii]
MPFSQSIFFSVIIVFAWQICTFTTFGHAIAGQSNDFSGTNAMEIQINKTNFTSAVRSSRVGPLWEVFNTLIPTAKDNENNQFCDCTCGLSKGGFKIVGGRESTPHKHPWMARLTYRGQSFCGGTLISERHVITAAHCTNSFNWFTKRYVKVVLGTHDKCGAGKNEWSSYVASVTTPSFTFMPIFGTDISLLKLSNPVPFSEFIKPICLPETNDSSDYNGRDGIVAGWGTTAEGGNSSCILKEVNLPIMTNDLCFKHTQYRNVSALLNKEYMMCAGFPEGKADSCQEWAVLDQISRAFIHV